VNRESQWIVADLCLASFGIRSFCYLLGRIVGDAPCDTANSDVGRAIHGIIGQVITGACCISLRAEIAVGIVRERKCIPQWLGERGPIPHGIVGVVGHIA
jgi:hypothetical protein